MTTNRTRAFVAALAMISSARAAETIPVHALECVFEVPATYEFTVSPASEVRISKRGSLSEQITITGLNPEFPPRTLMKMHDRVTNGPLTIERFVHEESGEQPARSYSFTLVRGRKQQIQFTGLSAADVDGYVAQCLKSMPPALLAATARRAAGCKGELSLNQVTAAMGGDVRGQPVFSDGALKGWRLYSTQTSARLSAQGIENGALMTHICGVPGSEVFADGGNVCCNVDVSREFVVTFKAADRETKVVIKR